jgi:hypothetical protein
LYAFFLPFFANIVAGCWSHLLNDVKAPELLGALHVIHFGGHRAIRRPGQQGIDLRHRARDKRKGRKEGTKGTLGKWKIHENHGEKTTG